MVQLAGVVEQGCALDRQGEEMHVQGRVGVFGAVAGEVGLGLLELPGVDERSLGEAGLGGEGVEA